MRMPIRIRLSIGYFLIFSFAGVLLCVASYYMARRSLYFEIDHELDEHIDDVRDFLAAHHLDKDYKAAQSMLSAEFQVKDDGKWLQVQDGEGRWIYRPRRMLIAPHDLPRAASLPGAGNFTEFSAGPKRVRSLRRAFEVRGETYVAESGITLTKTSLTLDRFRNGLLLISPAVFLMAGLAGHLLSRRALDPVAAIAREAQRIHDGNLQTRLPRLETHDELEHLSSTLNEMLERIESGVQSVRDFTAHASHELRTPVALIRTEVDLALQFDRSSGEYREAIQIIGDEAHRMSSLLDSLLFLARADAGAEKVQLEPQNARQLCAQAADRWRFLLRDVQIHVMADLPVEPVVVLADRQYLQRLLNIVLENSGKYTPAGGSIKLALHVSDGAALFTVSDNGIGIPEQDQCRIFERFFRGSNVQEANAHGSGLGLALAAWIAARHQTEIHVSSAPHAGTRLSWRLPLAHVARMKDGDALPSADRVSYLSELSIRD
jgi:signal transduction histidine kinase